MKNFATSISNNKGVRKLKEAWDENPMTVIAVGAGAILAAAKFVDAVSAAQGRRAYAKQVDYRVKTRH